MTLILAVNLMYREDTSSKCACSGAGTFVSTTAAVVWLAVVIPKYGIRFCKWPEFFLQMRFFVIG